MLVIVVIAHSRSELSSCSPRKSGQLVSAYPVAVFYSHWPRVVYRAGICLSKSSVPASPEHQSTAGGERDRAVELGQVLTALTHCRRSETS